MSKRRITHDDGSAPLVARCRPELFRDMVAIRNAVGNPKERSTILKSTSDAKIQSSRAMIREAKRRLAIAKAPAR